MCNQCLVIYIKLMIYDEARATVKYLNYIICVTFHMLNVHMNRTCLKKAMCYVPFSKTKTIFGEHLQLFCWRLSWIAHAMVYEFINTQNKKKQLGAYAGRYG